MQIILSPVASSRTTAVSVDGLTITVDGIHYDLSVIPEGGQATATPDSPFIGVITRESVTITYRYDGSKAEAIQSTDIADFTFNIESGEVPCPIKWKPEPEVEGEAE